MEIIHIKYKLEDDRKYLSPEVTGSLLRTSAILDEFDAANVCADLDSVRSADPLLPSVLIFLLLSCKYFPIGKKV